MMDEGVTPQIAWTSPSAPPNVCCVQRIARCRERWGAARRFRVRTQGQVPFMVISFVRDFRKRQNLAWDLMQDFPRTAHSPIAFLACLQLPPSPLREKRGGDFFYGNPHEKGGVFPGRASIRKYLLTFFLLVGIVVFFLFLRLFLCVWVSIFLVFIIRAPFFLSRHELKKNGDHAPSLYDA
jgi:hypothetical protein